MKLSRLLAFVTVVALAASVQAGSLEKRHQLGLKLGFWNQVTDVRSEVGITSVTTSVESSGPAGAVVYGYWIQPNLALTVCAGSMMADVTSEVSPGTVTAETAVVVRLMMGVKYHFLESSLESQVRPHLIVEVGPFIGSQTKEEVGLTVVTESRSEMAIGSHLGAGTDFLLGRHFILGATVGYNLMTDFEQPIGGSKNYSGPEFSISFAYIFGSGE